MVTSNFTNQSSSLPQQQQQQQYPNKFHAKTDFSGGLEGGGTGVNNLPTVPSGKMMKTDKHKKSKKVRDISICE